MKAEEINRAFEPENVKRIINEMLQETSKYSKTGMRYSLYGNLSVEETAARVRFTGLGESYTGVGGRMFRYAKAERLYESIRSARPARWFSARDKELRVYDEGHTSPYGRTLEMRNYKAEFNRDSSDEQILEAWIRSVLSGCLVDNTAISIFI